MVLWGVVEAGAWSVMIWGLVGCNMYGGHKVPRHNHARQRTLQLVALCIFLAVRHAAKDKKTSSLEPVLSLIQESFCNQPLFHKW